MFTPDPHPQLQTPSFAGSKLILPCVSVGNVAQLTVDLLINTLRLSRVGFLQHSSILPLVGRGAYSHTPELLHTAAEVYHSSELKVTVVQLRTPIAKGRTREFCDSLFQWVESAAFSETLLLTSSHAHERLDSQIEGSPFRFILTPPVSGTDLHTHLSENLNWALLEPRSSTSISTTTTSHSSTNNGVPTQSGLEEETADGVLSKSQLFVPGSGLAKKLYLKWCSNKEMKMVVVVMFSYQGDNIKESVQLADHVDSWLLLRDTSEKVKEKNEWNPPPSWDLMYGGPSPHSLF